MASFAVSFAASGKADTLAAKETAKDARRHAPERLFPRRQKWSHGARQPGEGHPAAHGFIALRDRLQRRHRGRGSLSLRNQVSLLLAARSAHPPPDAERPCIHPATCAVRIVGPVKCTCYGRFSFWPGETLRRGTSGLASGSESGERVCLSARQTQNRKPGPSRPGSWSSSLGPETKKPAKPACSNPTTRRHRTGRVPQDAQRPR